MINVARGYASQNKNNAIAFANRRIPYIPELRGYCQTVTSCLLMTQLEYRFAAMPNGFYKFLAPCDNRLYKEGDSWIEELSFSEAEIRTAFDNIGVRYRSKRQLQEIIDNQQDPFEGKIYLSYRDVKNGLTYYLRNHDLASTLIDSILNGFKPPILSTSEPTEETEDLELKKVHFQRSTKFISRAKENSSPLIEQKKTTKEDAAEAKESVIKSNHILIPQTFSAASFISLSEKDRLITQVLTAKQNDSLRVAIKQLQQNKLLTHLSFEQAVEAVADTLLSPKTYINAGTDFLLKLNTIKRSIQNGTWASPVKKIIDKQHKHKKMLDEINRFLIAERSSIEHYKKMHEFASKDQDKELWLKNQHKAEMAYQEKLKQREEFLREHTDVMPSLDAVEACVA